MNEKVAMLLNEQINKEFYSAYLYLDIANFYTKKGLDGFANWYEVQAKEEQDHAMLMYRYLQNNDQQVTLETIAKPDAVFETLVDPLKVGLAHERYVTSLINTIYDAAAEHRFTLIKPCFQWRYHFRANTCCMTHLLQLRLALFLD